MDWELAEKRREEHNRLLERLNNSVTKEAEKLILNNLGGAITGSWHITGNNHVTFKYDDVNGVLRQLMVYIYDDVFEIYEREYKFAEYDYILKDGETDELYYWCTLSR